jgi:hypothetical protein
MERACRRKRGNGRKPCLERAAPTEAYRQTHDHFSGGTDPSHAQGNAKAAKITRAPPLCSFDQGFEYPTRFRTHSIVERPNRDNRNRLLLSHLYHAFMRAGWSKKKVRASGV